MTLNKLELQEDVARSYIQLGIDYLKSDSTYDRSLQYFKKAIDVCEKCSSKIQNEIKGMAEAGIGDIHYYKGEYKEALPYFERAKNYKEDAFGEEVILTDIIELYRSMALASYYVAVIDDNSSYFDKSLVYYSEAIQKRDRAMDTIKNLRAKISLYHDRGVVHEKLGNYEKSIEDYKKALEINHSMINPDLKTTFTCLKDIGAAYYNGGVDYKESINYFKEAYSVGKVLYKDEDSPIEVTNILNEMAFVYYQLENYDECVKSYKESLKEWQKYFNDRSYHKEIIDLYLKLRDVYAEMDNITESAKYKILIAEMQFKSSAYQNEKDSLYDNLGDAYLEKGNYEESIKNYKLSCEIRQTSQQIEKIVKSLIKIQNYYSKVDNEEKLQYFANKITKILKNIEELSTSDLSAETVEINFLGEALLKENYCEF